MVERAHEEQNWCHVYYDKGKKKSVSNMGEDKYRLEHLPSALDIKDGAPEDGKEHEEYLLRNGHLSRPDAQRKANRRAPLLRASVLSDGLAVGLIPATLEVQSLNGFRPKFGPNDEFNNLVLDVFAPVIFCNVELLSLGK